MRDRVVLIACSSAVKIVGSVGRVPSVDVYGLEQPGLQLSHLFTAVSGSKTISYSKDLLWKPISAKN